MLSSLSRVLSQWRWIAFLSPKKPQQLGLLAWRLQLPGALRRPKLQPARRRSQAIRRRQLRGRRQMVSPSLWTSRAVWI